MAKKERNDVRILAHDVGDALKTAGNIIEAFNRIRRIGKRAPKHDQVVYGSAEMLYGVGDVIEGAGEDFRSTTIALGTGKIVDALKRFQRGLEARRRDGVRTPRAETIPRSTVLRVPFVPQPGAYLCSETSAAMVLAYYLGQSPLTPQQIHDAGYVAYEDMPRLFGAYGLKTTKERKFDAAAIKRYIARGVPVMLRVRTRADGHTVVVYGYEPGKLYLLDPELGAVVMPNQAVRDVSVKWFAVEG